MSVWLRLQQVAGRISIRLLVVNALALLVPIAGLEFARIYERQLLDSLERDMKNQAVLVSALLEEDLEAGRDVAEPGHGAVLARAARSTRTRVRILDRRGELVADSHEHGPPEGPEPAPPSMLPIRASDVRAVGRDLGGRELMEEWSGTGVPVWPDVPHRSEVERALAGERATYTRIRDSEPAVLLFLAEPVLHRGRVEGVVYITRSTQPVMVELYRIRSGLIRVLAVALLITGLTTLLLAWSISRPLSSLSRAAKRIAHGEREVEVPIGGSGEIRELAESFAAMKERLDARMRYISDFSADVAHEFKSPLTSIRGAAELLGEGAADDPEARRRFLRNIELDVDRLDRLVSRLLELSRIEASDHAMTPVDLPLLVRRVVDRHGSADHPVTLDYRSHIGVTLAREADLETALSNLIENAIRFSPAGQPVLVEVSGAAPLHISVRDRGPGIPGSIRGRIFDRFFTTDAERNGTGLGLSIVQSVARAHGGHVDVSTEEGSGTAVVLVLPGVRPVVT
jgi:two-component system, OmpR family, sensor histidine kinase ChvG